MLLEGGALRSHGRSPGPPPFRSPGPPRVLRIFWRAHPHSDQGVRGRRAVAKMASHAIFQYNVLAIDDTHNTWTNMIVKMTILRLLGSSDDKEKIGVATWLAKVQRIRRLKRP